MVEAIVAAGMADLAETIPDLASDPTGLVSGGGWLDNVILHLVLGFDGPRVRCRAVSPLWRDVVEAGSPPYRRYDPPRGGLAVIELEEDLQLNKLLYSVSLRFGSSAAERSVPGSTVAFMNWVPSYYRSNPNDDRGEVHGIPEDDAISAWILVTKLLSRVPPPPEDTGVDLVLHGREACIACSGSGCRLCGGAGVRNGAGPLRGGTAASSAEGCRGFLRVRSGIGSHAPQEGCSAMSVPKHRLSSQEVTRLRALLDHRRNPRLQRQERARAPIVPFGGVSNT